MHQTNDKIRIGENAKFTQHDPYLDNANECDDEEHLEAPHRPILSVNVANKNSSIRHSKILLGGHTRSRPRFSFAPFDSKCPK